MILFNHIHDYFSKLIGYLTEGPVIAFELMREGAIQGWRELLGPTDSVAARSDAPMSIRARFGKGQYRCEFKTAVKNQMFL